MMKFLYWLRCLLFRKHKWVEVGDTGIYWSYTAIAYIRVKKFKCSTCGETNNIHRWALNCEDPVLNDFEEYR